jgi:VanZ family protein
LCSKKSAVSDLATICNSSTQRLHLESIAAFTFVVASLIGLRLPITISRAMSALFKQILFSPAYRKLRYRSAFLLYLMIVLFGAIPGVRAEAGEIASGLVLHSLAYSTIAYLLFTGASQQNFSKAVHAFLWVVVMGALDEAIQSFFPYRNGRMEDWLVDMCAALVMLCVLLGTWPALQRTVYSTGPALRK